MKNRTHLLTVAVLQFAGLGIISTGCQKEVPSHTKGVSSKTEVSDKKSDASAKKLASTDPQSAALGQKKSTPTVKVHMKEHLTQAERLRQGVQLGELETTREAAAWLAEHELSPHLAEKWEPHVAMMKKAAHSARDAKDLGESAVAVGSMGEACASCHREIAGPKLEKSSPPTGKDLKAQMGLHAWAAQQMWLGLITPSDEAWVRGADAMAQADLTPDELFSDRSPGEELMKQELVTQKIASEARSIQETNAMDKRRGEMYAQLLSTCSTCHTAVKKVKVP